MISLKLSKPLLLGFFSFLVLGVFPWWQNVRSANLTNVSITLSTPRLSYSGKLDGGNTVGSSVITVQTTPGNAASTSSANLFEGNRILIGSSQYQVASVSAGNSFTITGLSSTPAINVLQTGDADNGDQVIASRSTSLTARFTTVSALANSSFRVLVPAATTNANDALPDQTGWDFGGGANSTVSVTCPGDVTDYDFVAGVATASALTRAGIVYHSFLCKYSGNGGNGTNFTSTNNEIVISNLINPSPKVGHTEGYADTYKIIVEHLNTGDTIVDQTSADTAVIESVLVTASVPPQITFRIIGTASGASRCGITTSVTSTATLVPLGELLIDAFKYASQELVVSTNAQNGYSVTAVADNQLHRVGAACVGDATTGGCIPDSVGDTATMTQNTEDMWLSTATKGFGYSLADNTVGTSDMAFYHNSSNVGCDGSSGNCWRQFADGESSQAAVTLFSSSTVVDSDSAYVCYKSVVSATQQAGTDYSTGVTYRATATF
jgi:hypothetical protein